MNDFHKVTAALNTMQFEPGPNSPGIFDYPNNFSFLQFVKLLINSQRNRRNQKRAPHAPLASTEDIDQVSGEAFLAN